MCVLLALVDTDDVIEHKFSLFNSEKPAMLSMCKSSESEPVMPLTCDLCASDAAMSSDTIDHDLSLIG